MRGMFWLLITIGLAPGLAMKVKTAAELQTMFETHFPGSIKFNCSQYSTDMSFRFHFAVRHFLNQYYKMSHNGSILITANGDILTRHVIGQSPSSKTILCFEHFREIDFLNPYDDPVSLHLSSLIRLVPFVTEIYVTGYSRCDIPVGLLTYKSFRACLLQVAFQRFFPDLLGHLPFLTILSLTNSNLTSVPPSILNLRYLTHLIVDNNPRLSSLEAISGHPSLKVLMARNCAIEHLPSDLPQLTDLYLSSNRLSNMDGIETLGYGNDREKSFFLDRNRIESVSDKTSSVKNLTTLNLNSNRLFEIPASIIDSPSLRRLYIEKNCFRSDVLVDMVSELNITHSTMTFKHNNQRPLSKGVCPEN